MRWWQALRQAYPKRSALTLLIAVFVFCVVIGGGFVVAADATIHATSTEPFCSSCHTNDAAAEFKGTVHDTNRTGVRATTICPGFITTPMTENNKFPMPQLMTAEYAAGKMIRAIRAGKKVYNFPWRLHLMVKLSRWLPDGMVNWVMGDYETEAQEAVAARQKQEPPLP